MQDLIEEAIRWVGYFSLRAITFGRYVGGGSKDRLSEGAIGLALIALVSYVIVAMSTRSG